MIDILVRPICKISQHKKLGVPLDSTVKLVCDVLAKPTDVSFYWAFNNSEEMLDVPVKQPKSNHLTSIAEITPRTYGEYGTLFCWAKNSIGLQKVPCGFDIIPEG